ncbi:permease-like cell division protein FtsX [Nonomuraea sp. NPDC052265]|uniref:permease-like cell division protein FtsX n=1 Tax=Nonomuraea sp. NPDC052265 TaxID=3364374 RepID=UPI0037CAE85A
MKRWLWRVLVAFVVVFSGMAGQAAAEAGPGHEGGVGEDSEIAVFLCTPSSSRCDKRYATARQRRDVEAFLKSTPEVTEVRFVSRAAAYARFRREYADQKKLLAEVRAEDMPDSFRVRVSGVADRARIVAVANSRRGVGLVIDQVEGDAVAMSSRNAEVSVFLCMKDSFIKECRHGRGRANKAAATAKEKKAVVAVIERFPGLVSYEYEDQKAAYQNFVEEYADNETLVAATRVSDMPESYRVSVRPEVNRRPWRHRLAGMPGVSQVFDRECLLQGVRLLSEYGLEDLASRTRTCG